MARKASSVLVRARLRRRTLGEARLALLRERGGSLSEIARALGKTLSGVSRTNAGLRRSRTIEREIARRLGLSEVAAFPEWYS